MAGAESWAWAEEQFEGARLGGHMGSYQGTRVDHLPGWLTLWRGMQTLQLMVQGAELAASLETFGV